MVLYIALGIAALFVIWIIFNLAVYNSLEKPKYTVLEQTKDYEIRSYEPILIAEVETVSDMQQGRNGGFMQVADFIFGNNTSRSKEGAESIKMTAPVLDTKSKDGKRTLAFTMPSKWNKDSLPMPNNSDVKVKTLEEQTYAVLRYSGSWSEAKQQSKTEELKMALEKDGKAYEDTVVSAFYNDPSTLPFLRRNEIMIPLINSTMQDTNTEAVGHNNNYETATFAAGCFWCTESVFEAQDGVLEVTSGYIGGSESTATYKQVSSGNTKHREGIQLIFDPEVITYEDLLALFWRSIDPTDKGGQFVDRGTQYLTGVYYHSDQQKKDAENSKYELSISGKFDVAIITNILPYTSFFEAEEEHQDYYVKKTYQYNQYKDGSGRNEFDMEFWKK